MMVRKVVYKEGKSMSKLMNLAMQANREYEMQKSKYAAEEFQIVLGALPNLIKQEARCGHKEVVVYRFCADQHWRFKQPIIMDQIKWDNIIKPLISYLKKEGFKT